MRRLPSNEEALSSWPPAEPMKLTTGVGFPKLPNWMRFDPFLWIIVGLFVIYEIVAHFGFHNQRGMRTLSNRVYALIKLFGWPMRGLLAVGCVALALHLQGIF